MKLKNINEHFKYSKEGFTKETLIENGKMRCFLINLMPGQSVPQHSYEGSEGAIYMVKASMLFRIDQRDVCAAEGDIISFHGNEMLGVRNNTGINASCMITVCPNPDKEAASDIQEIGFQSGELYNNLKVV